ncbi:hypothetical protein ACJZ2D_016868 [Fusarium nematophilum]
MRYNVKDSLSDARNPVQGPSPQGRLFEESSAKISRPRKAGGKITMTCHTQLMSELQWWTTDSGVRHRRPDNTWESSRPSPAAQTTAKQNFSLPAKRRVAPYAWWDDRQASGASLRRPVWDLLAQSQPH